MSGGYKEKEAINKLSEILTYFRTLFAMFKRSFPI